ncbi:MAG: hypothetical protein U1F57_11315 [bacterium]
MIMIAITQLEGIQRRDRTISARRAFPFLLREEQIAQCLHLLFSGRPIISTELTRSRNYDPSLLSETLDQYYLILLHGFELFFPQHSTLLLRPSGWEGKRP